MKNLLKFSAFALLFSMGAFLTSCGDDDDDSYCYECEVGGTTFELCEGDNDPASGTDWTRAELDVYAEAINQGGTGSCEKK